MGFLNRVSPKAVREYLDGDSEDPNPPQPGPCPRAAECPSWCGRLQETGEFPFPLTPDGKYESCRYWQFLERYGAMDPEQREIFAQAAAEEERGRRQKKQREQPRSRTEAAEPEPAGDEAGEYENDGEETETREKPQGRGKPPCSEGREPGPPDPSPSQQAGGNMRHPRARNSI